MFRLPGQLRFSLGELLFFALIVALGLAALKTGGLFAAAYLFAGVALFAGLLVAASLERGANRAFAVGFLLSAAAYGGVLVWYGEGEFDPTRGELFATRAAKPLYFAVCEAYYVEVDAGWEAGAAEAEAAARAGLIRLSY